MKVKKDTQKNIYLGVQLLRIIFSFHILILHCINLEIYKSYIIKMIIKKVSIDLGTFFIISFYFSYNNFTSSNIIKIKQRFIRLLIPYFIWPIIFFILNIFTGYIYKRNTIKFKYLYYQFLIGNGIHPIFWFQFNLLFLSLLFAIIILINRKRYLSNLFLMAIVCYLFINYSNYSLLFLKYNDIAFFSTRPIAFSFIYCFIGFYLFSINIIEKTNKYKIKIIIICLFILFLCINSKLSFYLIIINSLTSTSLFILFLIIPFPTLNNTIFIKIIKQLANYSAGIYYLHNQIQYLLDYFIKSRTIFACLINYLLCNLICFFGLKIFKKSNLRFLYI